MSKYKDTLVQELYNGREPEDFIETEDGAWYGRYPLEDGDLVGAILYEDTDGGISGTFFEDADELAEAWDELGQEDEDEEESMSNLKTLKVHTLQAHLGRIQDTAENMALWGAGEVLAGRLQNAQDLAVLTARLLRVKDDFNAMIGRTRGEPETEN